MLKFINIAVAFAVAVSVWFLFAGYSSDVDIKEKPKGHMAAVLPLNPAGWTGRDIPLGPTEEVKRSVEKNLDTSDYINREYTSPDGSKSFVLYISYWGSGKADPKAASAHTPDRCWVLNGWISDKSKASSDKVFDFDGEKLMPAYYREMTYPTSFNERGMRRNVCFWHTVDGKRFDYGFSNTIYASLSLNYLKHAFQSAFVGAPEQYFIRVDSQSNFDELSKEGGFREVIKALGKLVLDDKPVAEEKK